MAYAKLVGASFSIGRVAYAHDIRKSMKKNVDKNLVNDNVILEDRLQGRSIEEYTNGRMQPVIDEHNSKQRRSDRKINVPYTEYFNKKHRHGQLAYEAVLQYGEHEDLGREYYDPSTPPARRAEIYREFVDVYSAVLDGIKKRFPHMEILYATIHFDEPGGTPHMHLCYQPIGDRYRQGLSQQVSIGNALACDGIERSETRQQALEDGGYQMARFFQQVRREIFMPELIHRGYEIKSEQHGIKHEEPDVYKALERARATLAKTEQIEAKTREGMQAMLEEHKSVSEALDALVIRKEQLQGELQEIRNNIITAQECREIRERNNPITGKTTISSREYRDLKSRALEVEELGRARVRVRSKEQDLQEKIDEYQSLIDQYGSLEDVLRLQRQLDEYDTLSLEERLDIARNPRIFNKIGGYEDVCALLENDRADIRKQYVQYLMGRGEDVSRFLGDSSFSIREMVARHESEQAKQVERHNRDRSHHISR